MRTTTIALSALCIASVVGSVRAQSGPADPFAIVRAMSDGAVTVPPRALAVIPERHTGRLIRVTDELERVEPSYEDLALGLGLSSANSIQLRTREANVPIFVAKTDASISTVLGLRLGTSLEVTGLLVERGGRYLMLASEIRTATARSR